MRLLSGIRLVTVLCLIQARTGFAIDTIVYDGAPKDNASPLPVSLDYDLHILLSEFPLGLRLGNNLEVVSVERGAWAARSGTITLGDRIVAIDGNSTVGLTTAQFTAVLSQAVQTAKETAAANAATATREIRPPPLPPTGRKRPPKSDSVQASTPANVQAPPSPTVTIRVRPLGRKDVVAVSQQGPKTYDDVIDEEASWHMDLHVGPIELGSVNVTRVLLGPAAEGCTSHPIVWASPVTACSSLTNGAALKGTHVLVKRGDCSVVSKVLQLASWGAKSLIIVDDTTGGGVRIVKDAVSTIMDSTHDPEGAKQAMARIALVMVIDAGGKVISTAIAKHPRRQVAAHLVISRECLRDERKWHSLHTMEIPPAVNASATQTSRKLVADNVIADTEVVVEGGTIVLSIPNQTYVFAEFLSAATSTKSLGNSVGQHMAISVLSSCAPLIGSDMLVLKGGILLIFPPADKGTRRAPCNIEVLIRIAEKGGASIAAIVMPLEVPLSPLSHPTIPEDTIISVVSLTWSEGKLLSDTLEKTPDSAAKATITVDNNLPELWASIRWLHNPANWPAIRQQKKRLKVRYERAQGGGQKKVTGPGASNSNGGTQQSARLSFMERGFQLAATNGNGNSGGRGGGREEL